MPRDGRLNAAAAAVDDPSGIEVAQKVQREAGRERWPRGKEQEVVEWIQILLIGGECRDPVRGEDETVGDPLLKPC